MSKTFKRDLNSFVDAVTEIFDGVGAVIWLKVESGVAVIIEILYFDFQEIVIKVGVMFDIVNESHQQLYIVL
jgi:hypothetical protein